MTAAVAPTPALPTATPEPTVDPRIITPANAAKLVELRQLGLGTQTGAALYTPDGRWLLLPTATGVYRYATAGYAKPQRILTVPVHEPVDLSTDGQTLAIGSRLFDMRGDTVTELTGAQLPEDLTKAGPAQVTRYSSDGQTLGLVYFDQQAAFFARADGHLLYRLAASEFNFSTDGHYLFALENRGKDPSQPVKHVCLYDAASGKLLHDWTAERARFVAGERLAVESGGAVRLYDLATLRAVQALDGRFAGFSPDGQTAAVYIQGELRLINVADRKVLAKMKVEQANIDDGELTFSPDGQSLAAVTIDTACCGGYDARMTLYHVPDGQVILHGLGGPQIFSPDGQSILTQELDYTSMEFKFQVRSTHDGAVRATLDWMPSTVIGLAFVGDGQQLIAATYGGYLSPMLFYNVESGELLRKLPTTINSYDYGLATSSDGRLVALSNELWETASGKPLTVINGKIVEYSHQAALGVAFSPESARLAGGKLNGHFEIWDIPGQRLVMDQAACEEYFYASSLAFSPDGQRLALACTDAGQRGLNVQVWQVVPEAKRLMELTATQDGYGFTHVAYSRDGALIAATGNQARVWNAADGAALLTVPQEDIPVYGALSLALSPDGQILALGFTDGSVDVWGVAGGQKLRSIPGGNYNPVHALAFSPDGTLLAVGLDDGSVRIWGVK
jgi:WD40 repeat protein